MWIRVLSIALAGLLCAGAGSQAYKSYNPQPNAPEQQRPELPVDVQKTVEEKAEPAEDEGNSQAFFAEWQDNMQDFDPSSLVNFLLPAGQKRVFFEKVDRVPQVIRGTYFVSAKKTNKINFVVYGPSNMPIVTKTSLKEVIFHFQVNDTGEYRFEFTNGNVSLSRVRIGIVLLRRRGGLWSRTRVGRKRHGGALEPVPAQGQPGAFRGDPSVGGEGHQ